MLKKIAVLFLLLASLVSFAACGGGTELAAVAQHHNQMAATTEIKEFFTNGNFNINLSSATAKIIPERENKLMLSTEQSLNLSMLAFNRYRSILQNPELSVKGASKDAAHLTTNLNNLYDSLIILSAQKAYIESASFSWGTQGKSLLNDFVYTALSALNHATQASHNVLNIFKKYIGARTPFNSASTDILRGYAEAEILSAYLSVLAPSYRLFAADLKNNSLFIYGDGTSFNTLNQALAVGARLSSISSDSYYNLAQGIYFENFKREFLRMQASLKETLGAMQFATMAIEKFNFLGFDEKIIEIMHDTYNGEAVTKFLNTHIDAELKGHYQYTTNVMANDAINILHSIDLFLTNAGL